MSQPRERIVILGGGPGGYEAALVAAQLGARVTVVDSDGLGGACVLTDCVPSKTLIATSTTMSVLHGAADLGIRLGRAGRRRRGWRRFAGRARPPDRQRGRPAAVRRVKALAQAQSADVALRLAAEGVEIIKGRAGWTARRTVAGRRPRIKAGAVLIATGALPRVLPGAEPDGERILNWRQLYDLPELPPALIVVGSGVTGAEFASAYQALGSQVTLCPPVSGCCRTKTPTRRW